MKVKQRIKFPCGYEMTEAIESIWITVRPSNPRYPLCPLHGKKCKGCK